MFISTQCFFSMFSRSISLSRRCFSSNDNSLPTFSTLIATIPIDGFRSSFGREEGLEHAEEKKGRGERKNQPSTCSRLQRAIVRGQFVSGVHPPRQPFSSLLIRGVGQIMDETRTEVGSSRLGLVFLVKVGFHPCTERFIDESVQET